MFREFFDCIRDLYYTDTVQAMQHTTQHVPTVNCLEHCLFVSFVSYRMAKKRGLDYRAAARGALLHDMFLYDQHDKRNYVGRHAAYHPLAALRNATARFSLSEVEKDCILGHMWPSAGQKPRFAESKIVNLADKICAYNAVAIEQAIAAGADGIQTAYALAQKNFRESGNNRVILATDGDLNVGVTSEGELARLVEEEKESGVSWDSSAALSSTALSLFLNGWQHAHFLSIVVESTRDSSYSRAWGVFCAFSSSATNQRSVCWICV